MVSTWRASTPYVEWLRVTFPLGTVSKSKKHTHLHDTRLLRFITQIPTLCEITLSFLRNLLYSMRGPGHVVTGGRLFRTLARYTSLSPSADLYNDSIPLCSLGSLGSSTRRAIDDQKNIDHLSYISPT